MPKSKLPAVTAQEAMKAFGKAGFEHVRSSGSHFVLKRPGYLYNLSIPRHGNTSLKSGMLRALIRDAGLEIDEFVALLKK